LALLFVLIEWGCIIIFRVFRAVEQVLYHMFILRLPL